MTLEEFLTQFAAVAPQQPWRLQYTCLRTADAASHCPLSLLVGAAAVDVQTAARRLGLAKRTAWRIAASADGAPAWPGYDPPLRAQLLALCGLPAAEAS